ncbi:MAG: transposase [Bacteroidales bacterium]|nr:transposase [Bacteroidales bacterium]
MLKEYNHTIVNHGRSDYLVGKTHTNTIKGFWSLFKRGVIGIYHFVSPKQLDSYCTEHTYRYNTVNCTLKERFDFFIRQSDNKRLKYYDLINKFGIVA